MICVMKKRKKGFTLVELSLSIVFISILSITMVMIINNTITSYRRGIVLSQINSVGMDLVDDIRGAVKNSPSASPTERCALEYTDNEAIKKCEEDEAENFVAVVKLATVTIGKGTSNQKQISNAPVFGAFCTGDYSYIWNSGYFMSDGGNYEVENVNAAVLYYKNSASGDVIRIPASDEDKAIKILKIKDEFREVCVSATKGDNNNNYDVKNLNHPSKGIDISNEFNISEGMIVTEEPEELISGDSNMAIYDLDAVAASNDKSGSLYSVSFILGTVQGGIDVMTSSNFCATPSEYEIENFDYCAINKFNFAALANGGR